MQLMKAGWNSNGGWNETSWAPWGQIPTKIISFPTLCQTFKPRELINFQPINVNILFIECICTHFSNTKYFQSISRVMISTQKWSILSYSDLIFDQKFLSKFFYLHFREGCNSKCFSINLIEKINRHVFSASGLSQRIVDFSLNSLNLNRLFNLIPDYS